MVGLNSAKKLTLAEFAVLCPLTVEWLAIRSRLAQAQDPADPSDLVLPSAYGMIAQHTVVCVKTGKGEGNSSSALQYVLGKWRPRWVVLAGIAGGFPARGPQRGDLIVANYVYNLDFGKLVNGQFLRRPEYDFQPDRGLLGHAEIVAEGHERSWLQRVRCPRPDGKSPSATASHVGYVASGDKVIDDPEIDIFKATLLSIPEVAAVEMEGSGAGAAIRLEQSHRAVGFLMIRGISDEPEKVTPGLDCGSDQRRAWKEYAADVASAFLEEFLHRRPPLAEVKHNTVGATPHPQASGVSDRTNSESLDALMASIEIRFSSLAESYLANISASSEEILRLVRAELAGHRLLLTLDYESHPRAVQKNCYVVLTKRGSLLTIESLNRSMPKSEVLDSWNKVCEAYLKAYALRFRQDHLVLAREGEFKRSFQRFQLMLIALSAFIETTRVFADEELFTRLHTLKNEAVITLERSESDYYDFLNQKDGEALLGRVALGLDSVVSSVHKILLEYSLPR